MNTAMTHAVETARGAFRFGGLAYFGAAVSLIFCFWKVTFSLIAPILGLTFIEINPHLQAITMSLSAAFTVGALYLDRRQHGQVVPFLTGIVGLLVIAATLYIFYHDAILATGYVLLLIAAFMNQNRMLACLNQQVALQAQDLVEINESLERRVAEQVEEIGNLARLKRFLPSEVANLITAEGNESLLDSHRRYISCLFCDIRRFTLMTDSMEPEDVMDVLRSYHERVGHLVVKYSGTIGYRAGDGVMVFFNDPIPCDDPDFRAIRLAFDLQKDFATLCRQWSKLGVDVGLGVGIASGYATMGVIGVEGSFDYTPFGNTVNLSARLCDRAQDGEILISNRTWAEVEEQVISESVGTLSLKGITQPVEAFLIRGMKEDSTVVSVADSQHSR